ncbi:MAG: hypothetical protein IBX56_10770 [Methylomicrobium sp.]|nr:hypothetical protein [Methylomicrobium sp.]
MTDLTTIQQVRFGFDFDRVGAHTSRTLMLDELTTVLSYLANPAAVKTEYFNAVNVDNCLNKRTQSNRKLTYRDLVKLYTLDPSVTIFRVLVYFWDRDPQGRPLLALLCAYCRDSLLRISSSFILASPQSTIVERERLQAYIEHRQPDRFSPATIISISRNINASWTQSGHLRGRVRKVRVKPIATPGNVAYALFLGYLTGMRGESLFKTEYVKLLGLTIDQAIDFAEEASRRGWIVFKRVGKTMEALFPNLLTQQEMEWLREQS